MAAQWEEGGGHDTSPRRRGGACEGGPASCGTQDRRPLAPVGRGSPSATSHSLGDSCIPANVATPSRGRAHVVEHTRFPASLFADVTSHSCVLLVYCNTQHTSWPPLANSYVAWLATLGVYGTSDSRIGVYVRVCAYTERRRKRGGIAGINFTPDAAWGAGRHAHSSLWQWHRPDSAEPVEACTARTRHGARRLT